MTDDFDLRGQIAALGLSQTGLARRMIALGDDRDEKDILRSIQRMLAGDARVSGEMRALLGRCETRKTRAMVNAAKLTADFPEEVRQCLTQKPPA